jgi:hypothetical protein
VIKDMAAIAMAFAVLTTTACGNDDKSPTGPGAIAGTYTLDRVDGNALPVTLFEGLVDVDGTPVQLRIELTGGTMTLAANNTFSGNLTARVSAPGSPSETENLPVTGTYTVSGSSITLTSSDPEDPQVTGTLANGQLIVDIDLLDTGEDFSLTFRK